jgi:hypothetical protein
MTRPIMHRLQPGMATGRFSLSLGIDQPALPIHQECFMVL